MFYKSNQKLKLQLKKICLSRWKFTIKNELEKVNLGNMKWRRKFGGMIAKYQQSRQLQSKRDWNQKIRVALNYRIYYNGHLERLIIFNLIHIAYFWNLMRIFILKPFINNTVRLVICNPVNTKNNILYLACMLIKQTFIFSRAAHNFIFWCEFVFFAYLGEKIAQVLRCIFFTVI